MLTRIGNMHPFRFPMILLVWSLFTLPLSAQIPIEGGWKGLMTQEGDSVDVQFEFRRLGNELVGTFSSTQLHVLEYPFDKTIYAPPSLRLSLVGDGTMTSFDGKVSEQGIEGTFQRRQEKGTFRLARFTPDPPPYSSEEVSFFNRRVSLSASLYIPTSPGKHAAIVFLHGSGAETRWGGSRFWSDYFARHGVAALIYDKRGTGQSGGNWRQADFGDLAEDALAAVEFLTKLPGIDEREIGVYGQSQGGAIAPLIASKSNSVAFVVSVAGPAVPMWQTEIYSLKNLTRSAGVHGDALTRADRFIELRVEAERTGKGRDQLAAAATVARQNGEPWYNLLKPPSPDSYFWSFFRGIANYDASIYWRRVQVPSLIVEAENDIYVPTAASISAIRDALQVSGNRDYTIVVLPGTPHTFLITSEKRKPFHWPYLYPGLTDLVMAWVQYRTAAPVTTSPDKAL
jgi:pimeloyl-ACP methyl ester carboxylesterase